MVYRKPLPSDLQFVLQKNILALPALRSEYTYIPMPNRWNIFNVSGSRLEAREGGTLVRVILNKGNTNYEERFYLFGGLGRGLLSNLSYFHFLSNDNRGSF